MNTDTEISPRWSVTARVVVTARQVCARNAVEAAAKVRERLRTELGDHVDLTVVDVTVARRA